MLKACSVHANVRFLQHALNDALKQEKVDIIQQRVDI